MEGSRGRWDGVNDIADSRTQPWNLFKIIRIEFSHQGEWRTYLVCRDSLDLRTSSSKSNTQSINDTSGLAGPRRTTGVRFQLK